MTDIQKALLQDTLKLRGFMVDYCNDVKKEYSRTSQYHNSVIDWIDKYRYSISDWLYQFASSTIKNLEICLEKFDDFLSFLHSEMDAMDDVIKNIERAHNIELACSLITWTYKRLKVINRYINNVREYIKLTNKQLSSRDGIFIDQLNQMVNERDNLFEMFKDDPENY